MHSRVRSNLSCILWFIPLAPLIVILLSIFFAGKTIKPAIVVHREKKELISSVGILSTMWFIFFTFLYVCPIPSLERKNSPNSDLWCSNLGVSRSKRKFFPLGSGLLQRIWWYFLNVWVKESVSFPSGVSEKTLKVMSILSMLKPHL